VSRLELTGDRRRRGSRARVRSGVRL